MKRILLSVCTVCAVSFAGYSQLVDLTIAVDGSYSKNYLSLKDRTVLTLTGTGCKTFLAKSDQADIVRVNDKESYVFPYDIYYEAYISIYCVRDTGNLYLGYMRMEIRE